MLDLPADMPIAQIPAGQPSPSTDGSHQDGDVPEWSQSVDGLGEAVLRLASQRDPAAWAVVVQRAGPHLWRLASKLNADPAGAEDAMQDALLLIRDHANSFRMPRTGGDRAALRWMMSIIANACFAAHRKRQRKRECSLGEAGQMTSGSRVGDEMDSSDTVDAVRLALRELPESTRQPIVLHFLGGLRLDEVAITLGVPLGTAKVRIHRGLKTLRERLGRIGIAVSLVAISGLLERLPAATCPDTAQFATLITSPLSPPPGVSTTPPRELSMASKIILASSVACVLAAIPFIAAEEHAPVAPADASLSPWGTAPTKTLRAPSALGQPGGGGVVGAAPEHTSIRRTTVDPLAGQIGATAPGWGANLRQTATSNETTAKEAHQSDDSSLGRIISLDPVSNENIGAPSDAHVVIEMNTVWGTKSVTVTAGIDITLDGKPAKLTELKSDMEITVHRNKDDAVTSIEARSGTPPANPIVDTPPSW